MNRKDRRKIVARYLNSLETRTSATQAELIARRDRAEQQAIEGSGIQRLLATQRYLNACARLRELEERSDAKAEFVKVGKEFAEHENISYDAFLEVGVPRSVLKEAGITP